MYNCAWRYWTCPNLQEGIENCKKSNMPWSYVCTNSVNCLSRLLLILSSVLENQVNLCYQVECPFWICLMLPWNSKFGILNSNLALPTFEVFHSNFVGGESFFESNSSNILALHRANLEDSINSSNFS